MATRGMSRAREPSPVHSHRPSPSSAQQSPSLLEKGLDPIPGCGLQLPQPLAQPAGRSRWAGAEAELCLSEAPSEEGSRSKKLRSVCSWPGLSKKWAEISHLSWSIEEGSSSESLPCEAWAEDGDLSGSVAEDSGSVSLPSELWSESSDQTAAVPVQRPSLFRRALRALRRAFRSLRHLLPVLQA